MSRLTSLFAVTCLVASGCTDDSTTSDPEPVTGPAVTPVNQGDTKVRVSPTSGLGVTEGGGTATFTVELTRKPTYDVTIHVHVDDDTEGSVDVDALVFTPADFGPRTVTVSGVDDTDDDGNQPFQVILGEAISRDVRYQSVQASEVAVTNVDDDTVGVTVLAADDLSTTEIGGTATFTVQLNTKPTAEVVVRLSNSNSTEVILPVQELRFYPREWNVPQTVTLTGRNDDFDDGDKVVTITTSRVESADIEYLAYDPADVRVTNVDDETAGLAGVPAVLEVIEGGAYYASVRLTSEPAAPVVVRFATAPGLGATTQLTFDDYNWRYQQSFYVAPWDDSIITGDRELALTVTFESADPVYQATPPQSVTVRVIENDSVALYLETYGTSEDGSCTQGSVALGSAPQGEVTVRLTSSDETEAAISPATVTFGGEHGQHSYVTICGVDDDLFDGDQTYRITASIEASTDPAYAALAPVSDELVNADNERHIRVDIVDNAYTTARGGQAHLAVSLGFRPSHDVVLPVVSSNPREGVTDVQSLTFTPDTWNVPQGVTVTGVYGDFVQWGAWYQVVVGPASTDDPLLDGRSAAVDLVNYY